MVGSITPGCIVQRSGVSVAVCGLESECSPPGAAAPRSGRLCSHTCRASPYRFSPHIGRLRSRRLWLRSSLGDSIVPSWGQKVKGSWQCVGK